MGDVTVKIKMSQAAAGALYMKSLKQEDTIKELQGKIADIYEIASADNDEDLMGDALHDIACLCH